MPVRSSSKINLGISVLKHFDTLFRPGFHILSKDRYASRLKPFEAFSRLMPQLLGVKDLSSSGFRNRPPSLLSNFVDNFYLSPAISLDGSRITALEVKECICQGGKQTGASRVACFTLNSTLAYGSNSFTRGIKINAFFFSPEGI